MLRARLPGSGPKVLARPSSVAVVFLFFKYFSQVFLPLKPLDLTWTQVLQTSKLGAELLHSKPSERGRKTENKG